MRDFMKDNRDGERDKPGGNGEDYIVVHNIRSLISIHWKISADCTLFFAARRRTIHQRFAAGINETP